MSSFLSRMLAVGPTRTRMAIQLFGIIILALLQDGYAQQGNEEVLSCFLSVLLGCLLCVYAAFAQVFVDTIVTNCGLISKRMQ